MKIDVGDIIDKQTDEYISFTHGISKSIQMPVEYIDKLTGLVRGDDICIVTSRMDVHKRLNVADHIKFMIRWYGNSDKVRDIIQQFKLEDVKSEPLAKVSEEINQRLGYVHAVLTDQPSILAVNPFYNATNENIRMFHKMMAQVKEEKKSIVVVVSRTEDAFLVQPDIMKLNDEGLHDVETEDTQDKEKSNHISKIKAKAEDKTIFVNIDEIEYLESSEGKVYINISGEKFMMESTLQDAEDKLESHGFYRCHRSYIVNLHKVKEIITWSKNTYSVVINNNDETKIPLSRTKYNEIQDLLVTL